MSCVGWDIIIPTFGSACNPSLNFGWGCAYLSESLHRPGSLPACPAKRRTGTRTKATTSAFRCGNE